jgi:hypothetical protein
MVLRLSLLINGILKINIYRFMRFHPHKLQHLLLQQQWVQQVHVISGGEPRQSGYKSTYSITLSKQKTGSKFPVKLLSNRASRFTSLVSFPNSEAGINRYPREL